MAHRVLVIDDSQTIRKLVELSFRTLPFAVDYATSGTEGIARAQGNPPEIVLLDVVLPDMKGVEVCRALSRDDRTTHSLVVLMTAKEAAVRDQFNSFSQVVGYLKKPFTAPDLLASLSAARQQLKERRKAPKSSLLSFEKKQIVAKELYTRLKGAFALIPEWHREMGEAQPATYFARKVLTPELIEELIAVLGEHLESALKAAGQQAVELEAGSSLSGQVTRFPLLEVLRATAMSRRTGRLVITVRSKKTSIYFRRGALLLVTSDSPADYSRGSGVDLSAVAVEARERAEAEQAKTGKPVFVTLAEAGQLSSGSLSRVLYVQGKQALLEALDAPAAQYQFAELPSLPLFVEAQGREVSFGQILLEQLRRTSVTLALDKGADAMQWVFERVPGFSRRLRQFSLTSDERRVLTVIDGRHSVAKVIRRSGMSPSLVSAVVHRLSEVELVRRVDRRQPGARRAVLVDPDVEGVQRPLEQLLARRRESVELVVIPPDEPDLLAAIARERPALVIVDATTLGTKAVEIGKRIFESPQFSQVSSAALLETSDPRSFEALVSAGFDAVLFKPVWFGDIEKLLNE